MNQQPATNPDVLANVVAHTRGAFQRAFRTTDPALIVESVADLIEPHITGTYRRRERAVCGADTLRFHGVLVVGAQRSSLPARERAANILQCQHSWKVAERIAADLAEAGLLASEEN